MQEASRLIFTYVFHSYFNTHSRYFSTEAVFSFVIIFIAYKGLIAAKSGISKYIVVLAKSTNKELMEH